MPDINKTDLVARLREACVGHPHAKIEWPHRVLHEAADAIEALMIERLDKAEAWDAIAAKNAIIASQAAEISRLRDALSDGDAIVARLREIINSGIEGKPGYETDKEIYAQMHGQVMRLLSWDAPRRSSTALEANHGRS